MGDYLTDQLNRSITIIENTERWLTESVIKYYFCPYAKQPYKNNFIAYHVYSGCNILTLLEKLAKCLIELDDSLGEREDVKSATSIEVLETSLLIIACDKGAVDYLGNFYDYLDVLDVANEFLEKPQTFIKVFSESFITTYGEKIPPTWGNKYQIASFHPNYQFEGTTNGEVENYTNRSVLA